MKNLFGLIVTIGCVMASCVPKENHFQSDAISGVYIREYSFKVVNPENGYEMGFATIRDTILIQQEGKRYQVVNNKWRLNNYDREGWQSMEHADDRPMSDYSATFEPKDSTLVAGSSPILYLDTSHSALYKGQRGRNLYRLIKPL
jgi:hypothetical protein